MVKQASGVVIAVPQPREGERVARRVLVYRTVLDAIANGALPPGTRLPSARQLAREWKFARGAVDEAYEQLQAEGLLERRTGDGTYVALTPAKTSAEVPAEPAIRPVTRAAQGVLNRFSAYLGKAQKVEVPLMTLLSQPLFPRAPMTRHFPLDVWRRLIARAHTEPHRQQLGYGAPEGEAPLREAIARHLSLTRGTHCGVDQILVINSPTQGIELMARVLLEPGDKVWLEDPGHSSLVTLFKVLHTHVVGVPLDEHGLNVVRGRELAPDAAAVYLHPLTQFPLGVRTTAARRAELLQWAETSGAWIIEANFNDELTHDAQAPTSLQAMDRSDRVLLMGTLEGIMYPSLRVAYLVVPARLSKVFGAMRGLMGDHTNVALQQALTWFIDEGHMSHHLRSLRQTLQVRRTAMRESCAVHLPEWVRIGPLDGGAHMCLHLPPAVSDREVVRRIRGMGVLGIALSSICIDPAHANGIALGFGAFEPRVIEASMRVIGDVLRQCAPTTGSSAPTPREVRA